MIILIGGASHTGKTLFSQKLLEKYKFTYLSIDHLKMGLIRSGNTTLTVNDDEQLADYLWKIVLEIINTAIENKQDLIVEGCYIPFDWKDSFDKYYLPAIHYYCLIMSEDYLQYNLPKVKLYESIIEDRMIEPYLNMKAMIEENEHNLEMCKANRLPYILIDGEYNIDKMIDEVDLTQLIIDFDEVFQ